MRFPQFFSGSNKVQAGRVDCLLFVLFGLSLVGMAHAGEYQDTNELVRRLSTRPAVSEADAAAAFSKSQLEDRKISSSVKAPDVNGACQPQAPIVGSSKSLAVVPYLAPEAGNAPATDIDLNFAFDSDHITPEDQRQLIALVNAFKSDPLKQSSFALIGHTDASGQAHYNLRLSCARALAVFHFLNKNHIPAHRLAVYGFGSTKLRDPNQPNAFENRRVEVRRLDN